MQNLRLEKNDVLEMLDHVPAVVFRLSHEGDNWRTIYVTNNISMYGYTREEFMRGEMTWFQLVHPDDRVLLSKTVHDYETHNINEFRLYYRVVTKVGDSIPVTEYNTVNRDAEGAILSYDTVLVNNSTASAINLDLLDNHYRQQIVLTDILMSLYDSDLDHALQIILDRTGEYLDTSRALLFKDSADHITCKVVYEWCNNDIISVKDLDYSITYETEMPEIYIALQKTGNLIVDFGEIPENCKEEFDAEGLIASAIFAVYLNGDHYGFVCFDDCIVERKWDEDTVRFLKNVSNLISTVIARQYSAEQLEESHRTIERMAYTDYLTGLQNRFSCDKELQKAIDGAKQSGQTGYVLFLDMDDFKIVNDGYGHDYGDAILVTFASWLQKTLPAPHKVFRFGGDEFIAILDYETEVDLQQILSMFKERVTMPWVALDREFYCTLSIGVVPYPAANMDSKTAIKQADIAMYEAKRKGKNQYMIYEERLETSSQLWLDTESLLRNAMENDFAGFEVYYQPILDKKTQQIEGAEALLRIKDGEKIVMPDDFIPLAEYLGFTIPIGEFVLKTALQTCKQIIDSGYPDFKMCVNMTQKQIRQPNVLSRFEAVLDEVGIPYANVIVSIAESTALQDADRIELICSRLQELGVLVTLDDFGSGSASFLQLGKVPVDVITTSIKLLDDIDDHYTQEFLNLIIDLCHSMHKKVCTI